MSTRSLTFVTENGSLPIICMYRQSDGYPSGHGKELAEFLHPIKIVDGLGMSDPATVANGAGCLAAQIVAHFKYGPGGVYIEHANKWKDCGQEYEYWVDVDGEQIQLSVYDVLSLRNKKLLYRGRTDQADFLTWFLEKE